MGQIVARFVPSKRNVHVATHEKTLCVPSRVIDIMRSVAAECGVDVHEMLGSLYRAAVHARQEAMRRVRLIVRVDSRPPRYSEIARWFGVATTVVEAACGSIPQVRRKLAA